MKKVAVTLLICLAFIGCATSSSNLTQEDLNYRDSSYPPGKNHGDWIRDEEDCHVKAGKITGIAGVLWLPALIHNLSGPGANYDECMREKGWYK